MAAGVLEPRLCDASKLPGSDDLNRFLKQGLALCQGSASLMQGSLSGLVMESWSGQNSPQRDLVPTN